MGFSLLYERVLWRLALLSKPIASSEGAPLQSRAMQRGALFPLKFCGVGEKVGEWLSELTSRDIVGMPVKARDRVRVVGVHIKQPDVRVARRSDEVLVRGDLKLVHLGLCKLDGAVANAAGRFPEPRYHSKDQVDKALVHGRRQ